MARMHRLSRKRATELGVRNRVHMLGQVSDAEKYAALSVSDAFVTASQHEGFGLVFLEAMAFGLPVLCYDRGGQTDFLVTGETGHVVKLNDQEAFVSALLELHQDHEGTRAPGPSQPATGRELFHRYLRRPLRSHLRARDRWLAPELPAKSSAVR